METQEHGVSNTIEPSSGYHISAEDQRKVDQCNRIFRMEGGDLPKKMAWRWGSTLWTSIKVDDVVVPRLVQLPTKTGSQLLHIVEPRYARVALPGLGGADGHRWVACWLDEKAHDQGAMEIGREGLWYPLTNYSRQSTVMCNVGQVPTVDMTRALIQGMRRFQQEKIEEFKQRTLPDKQSREERLKDPERIAMFKDLMYPRPSASAFAGYKPPSAPVNLDKS